VTAEGAIPGRAKIQADWNPCLGRRVLLEVATSVWLAPEAGILA
jgi:hypothetical protein